MVSYKDHAIWIHTCHISSRVAIGQLRVASHRLEIETGRHTGVPIEDRICNHQAHFQEPRTKGWLFDTLVTPALMYSAVVWAPGLTVDQWAQIERPQNMYDITFAAE